MGTLITANVISANYSSNSALGYGIYVHDSADNTMIKGNYIGMGIDGTTRLGNSGDGIYLACDAGVHNNVGVAWGETNYIACNTGWGVYDAVGDPAIVNNVIGFDINGTYDPNLAGGAHTVPVR